jgi:thioredoxin reductase
MNDCDVLVVGGGAAGLSAALVLGRARRTVVVVDAGQPRNAPAAHMHGFLSRDGLPPAELLSTGREEVTGYGVTIVHGTVGELTRDIDESAFQALLQDGQRLTARRVLVTTGLRDELPDIPGLADRWARDVLHCPYCHGWEVRDQPLGVLWHGPDTVRYAHIVRQWTQDLILFAPDGALTVQDHSSLSARDICVVEGEVDHLVIDHDDLTGVALTDGRVIRRSAVFVPPRYTSHSDLLAGLGCEFDDQGWVTTGPNGATSVPGVWVAGNVANPRAQVVTAAGEGSSAAIAINTDLVEAEIHAALALTNADAAP